MPWLLGTKNDDLYAERKKQAFRHSKQAVFVLHFFPQHGDDDDRLRPALYAHFTLSHDRWILSEYTYRSPPWRDNGGFNESIKLFLSHF